MKKLEDINQFWHQAWEEGNTGWQQEQINPTLLVYYDKLNLKRKEKVFLPLCGKSLDIKFFLDQGHNVLAAELSPKAIESFFDEHKIPYQKKANLYIANKLTIWQGDIFELPQSFLEGIELIYDRASLIALNLEQRLNYYEFMKRLYPLDCEILLLSICYDQHIVDGPPYSVPFTEIRNHLNSHYAINSLEEHLMPIRNSRFIKSGLLEVTQNVFYLKKKGPHP